MLTREEMQNRKKYLQLTYEDIARLSGVPLGTVTKFLMGYTDSPRYSTLEKLDKVLSAPGRYDRPQGGDDRFMLREASYAYGSEALEDHEPELFGKKQGEYTVDDYFKLPDDVRYELIDGKLYEMSAPTVRHQDLAGYIYRKIANHIEDNNGPCKVYIAPLDVKADVSRDDNMVQPDVIIICDRSKVTEPNIQGAPDLAVEVLSPSSTRRDKWLKRNLYKRSGVREYWIVDPFAGDTTVYLWENGTELIHIYDFEEEIPVQIWDGECRVCLARA